MNKTRLAEIGVIEMPVERGIRVPMDGLEDGAGLGTVELAGESEDAAGFRVEELQPTASITPPWQNVWWKAPLT